MDASVSIRVQQQQQLKERAFRNKKSVSIRVCVRRECV
jgi:hypothetical protein